MHAMMGYLAGMIAALSGALYILSICSGKTQPNKATWLIWMVIDGIILESYFRLGARATVFVPLVLFIRAVIVFALLWRFNYNKCKWDFLDKICIGGAVVSLIPRLVFKESFVTLLITLVIIAIGAVPTIKKIYFDCGESENRMAWICAFISFIFNLFAVDYVGKNILEMVIYPASIVCIDAVIIFFLFWPRHRKIRAVGG